MMNLNFKKRCPISGDEMHFLFSERLMKKFDVSYFQCENCGFLATEKPYWLDEAYQSAIEVSDTGILSRNINSAILSEVIISALALQDKPLLDIAGGYGIFTRLMRDKGFNCYTIDKYCSNIFASNFEPSHGFSAGTLMAFEVLEHIEDPLKFLEEIFNQYNCRTLILSTEIFENLPKKEWWYYSFHSGQHISFYQNKTLTQLAKKLGCEHYQLSTTTHLFTDIKISTLTNLLISNKFLRKFYGNLVRIKRRKNSLTWQDHLSSK